MGRINSEVLERPVGGFIDRATFGELARPRRIALRAIGEHGTPLRREGGSAGRAPRRCKTRCDGRPAGPAPDRIVYCLRRFVARVSFPAIPSSMMGVPLRRDQRTRTDLSFEMNGPRSR